MTHPAYISPLAETLVAIAEDAGRAILAIQTGNLDVRLKDDQSPLTAADEAADGIIRRALRAVEPRHPIVSEESAEDRTVEANTFWLVDPLDGTKEFIAGRNEYTVNIALVRDHVPVMGTVHVPALGITYFCDEDGAWRKEPRKPARIQVRAPRPGKLTAVASRSHRDAETDDFLERHGVTDTVSVGSSLKFCLLAEGKADVYPRFGPTMEWDTAAGHAVLLRAGGSVETFDGNAFLYGKPGVRHPGFIARGSVTR